MTVLIQAVQAAALTNPAVAAKHERVFQRYERKLAEHRQHVKDHGGGPARDRRLALGRVIGRPRR
jgi:hypothetical protein